MDKYEWFESQFAKLSTAEQVEVFNKYCELGNYYKDEIYPMSEFNERCANCKPLDIVRMACANSHRINLNDDYFVLTWNGFKTLSYPRYYIENYLPDVFKCENAWNLYINIDYFVCDMYDSCLHLKPGYMNDEEFYDIVHKVALKYDTKNDIENAIKDILSKNLNGK